MTVYILLYFLFIALCGSMVLWGMSRQDRLFQYPTIAGLTWLFFFGVQAFPGATNPQKYPAAVLQDGGLLIALIMPSLCAAAGCIGYWHAGRSRHQWGFPTLSSEKLFWAGVALYTVGFAAACKLAHLMGGFVQQFTRGGAYSLDWVGAPVKYNFFIELMYPGLLLAFMSTVRRFSYRKLLVCVIMMLYPAAVVVFLGRRTKLAVLTSIVLLVLFFTKRIRVPKAVVLVSSAAILVIVYYAPAYRGAAQYGLNSTEIRESIARYDSVHKMMSGEKYCEFDVGVFWGAAVTRCGAFGLGIDIYNSIVMLYVPQQIVGSALKNSLLFSKGSREIDRVARSRYAWEPGHGSFLTGPYTAFRQFSFFGCLLYYVFGYAWRLLWEAAYTRSVLSAQLWYIACIILIPLAIVSSIVDIPGRAIYIAACMCCVDRTCRDSRMRVARHTVPNQHGVSVNGTCS